MRRFYPALLLLAAAVPASGAQPPQPKTINFVSPQGKGRIILTVDRETQWQLLALYDEGTRPVAQFQNTANHLNISYILFPNQTGSPNPDICRDDVLSAGQRSMSGAPGLVDIKQIKKTNAVNAAGRPMSIGSYLIASIGDLKIAEQNLFGVVSSASECAEIHISKDSYKPADDFAMQSALQTLNLDPDYSPVAQDYFLLGSLLYEMPKNYAAAAVYYQRALDTLPANASLNTRRVITDQLSMSYGISGQMKLSRTIIEAAIKTDPDYPLYYYNLACADAEEGKTSDAKTHLQQAFERKGNTLPGEHMPYPSEDGSIQKLKKNKEFWAFVQTLK